MNQEVKKVNNSVSIMGILNVTPDSFYDGGKGSPVERGVQLAKDGADIIDIGGESTRPFSEKVSLEEEIARVIPVIEKLNREVEVPLSIDTMKPEVAELAVKAGAQLINDVTGFRDPKMVEVAASNPHVDICVMHMQGEPKTMQQNPSYPEGVVETLLEWFDEKVDALTRAGIAKTRIILDPGIGFGKTVAHNLEIIENLRSFTSLGCRLLLGISRKSFMGKMLNKGPEELLDSTLIINALSVYKGVDILRVHDVKEHREVLDVAIPHPSY